MSGSGSLSGVPFIDVRGTSWGASVLSSPSLRLCGPAGPGSLCVDSLSSGTGSGCVLPCQESGDSAASLLVELRGQLLRLAEMRHPLLPRAGVDVAMPVSSTPVVIPEDATSRVVTPVPESASESAPASEASAVAVSGNAPIYDPAAPPDFFLAVQVVMVLVALVAGFLLASAFGRGRV